MTTENQGGTYQDDEGHTRNEDNKPHLKADQINDDVSGNDRSEEGREERQHHQQHGNRKYKMFSNHSSADDQPMTNTDTTP